MKCRFLKSLVAIWLIQLLLAASNVKADPLLLNPSSPWYGLNFENGWHFDVGLGFEYEPTYAGSDKYVSDVDVSARALYRLGNGNRFFINIGELGGVFSLSPDKTVPISNFLDTPNLISFLFPILNKSL